MSIPFDPVAVRALAMILVDTGLSEIEIEGKEGRIRVVRAAAAMVAAPTTTVPVVAAPLALPPAVLAHEEIGKHPGAVLSPMVGVAYLAPEPGATPFIAVGQTVAVGQTLLLIEAMKTFNQIKAPRAGMITRILVTPGSPVEYDEPLLILE
jgi:acetyl-CoA carboxylase biotin carboxyl carrier protein